MNSYSKINNNGEICSGDVPYLKDNRAFRYGDGLFESIRLINGRPYNLQSHIDRLFQGASTLSFSLPSHYSMDFFKSEIGKLISSNQIEAGAKIRLHLYRSGGGTYKSEEDAASFLITAEKMENNQFALNTEGLSIDVYADMKKERNILSSLKTSNALLYVMAMNFAKKNNLNEAFILNTNGHIIECSQSNVFLVSNGVLYTPPLSDGCVGGTMRMNLINLAIEKKVTIYESSLTPQNLLAADEIILTNAINGVQWVGAFRTKRYYNKIAKELLKAINEKEFNSNLKKDLQENLR
jgi:branched-subunit amino acid aminotransferase/4-amino-4-deoxychorismate lyase